MDNHLPQKHYLGVLARAAWFAYLSPAETDQLYYNWGKDEGKGLFRPFKKFIKNFQ